MFKEGQKLYSIFFNKCPRCHEGKFWPHNPYYNLFFNGGKLYDSCPNCGLRYYREIGFWYGAMFISYMFSVFVFLFGWAVTAFTFPEHWSNWWQIGTISLTILLLTPVAYFLSRLIWINVFVAYEPGKKETIVNADPKMSDRT